MSDCTDCPDCTIKHRRTRSMKRKKRNRLILIQNLNKGRARKEARCGFQMIPLPLKFACPMVYYLYADIAIAEQQDTITLSASLYNNFKHYKSAQVIDSPKQKELNIKVENKNSGIQRLDWRLIVERFEHSDSKEIREVSESVKEYCRRYEMVVQRLQKDQENVPNERYKILNQINEKTQQTRQSVRMSHGFLESKFQLKDGQIQLIEMTASEKYVTMLGHTLDSFAATVLSEGIPEMTPITSKGAHIIAKRRLQNVLPAEQTGYQTPEFDSCMIMKNGCVKKIRMRLHYHYSYEDEVPGFIIIGEILASEKPLIREVKPSLEMPLHKEFVEMMSNQEKDTNNFLSAYYDQTVEQKYTNLERTCKIKEILNTEELEQGA